MWKSNIKSTPRCILLDEYGLGTPKQCLTKNYKDLFINKYHFNLSKTLAACTTKKRLYTEKSVYRAYY